MKNEKIVIIGAVAAGSKCAFKTKRDCPDCDIWVYTEEQFVSYSACGLPFYIEGTIKDADSLIVKTPKDYEKAGINIHIQHRLLEIKPKEKVIVVKNLKSDLIFETSYDKLVLACGARPFVPEIENQQFKNIFTLRTIPDGINIKNKMGTSKNALIIGGGYIGIELLEAFVKNGLNVTMIEASSHIMSLFDEDMSDDIEKYILSKNPNQVRIIKNDYVVSFEGDDNGVKFANTKAGGKIPTDLVVIAVGVMPNTEIAKAAGIELGVKNSIRVNKKMQTNISDIYAIGDCAENINLVSNTPTWIPLGVTANKEGRCCAINLSGKEDEFEGVLGSAVTRYFDYAMSLTGLNEKTAKNLGYDIVSEKVTKHDRTIEPIKEITIKVIADRRSQQLLGVQAIGCGDADKRVNTAASALSCHKKIGELVNLDLTYAPPYSASIDPLLTAFIALQDKLEKEQ